MGDSIQEIVDYKAYKIKPYLNSDKEPFGLTINGKSKEYLHAHETLKQLMKKGKEYTVEEGVIKILDATNNKGQMNTIMKFQNLKEKGEMLKSKSMLQVFRKRKELLLK